MPGMYLTNPLPAYGTTAPARCTPTSQQHQPDKNIFRLPVESVASDMATAFSTEGIRESPAIDALRPCISVIVGPSIEAGDFAAISKSVQRIDPRQRIITVYH
jgi:hypothetical protein